MSKVTRALGWQVLGILLAILVGVVALEFFPVVDWIEAAQHRIAELGMFGGILYPCFYAVCNVLLLPAGVLSVGGGLFFGLWWGFAIVLAGNVLGAALAFLISRTVGRKWITRRLFRYRKWRALDRAIERESWKIVFLSQVHPLFPTSLINYLYGITRINFWRCMFWVLVGQAPGIFLYAYFGTLAQHGIDILQGRNHPRAIEYFIWGGGFAITMTVTIWLGRIALRLVRESEEKVRKNPKTAGRNEPALSGRQAS
jgi:uncharacterized membrane protein YdjX (TVP38/TMEM64 family)